jgi:DNA-3-methyladenine glycosylase
VTADDSPVRRQTAPTTTTSPLDLSRPAGRVLPSSFFSRTSPQVASDLIGKILWREGVGGGRLVEVEAYLPADDPACHAYRGMTPRNSVMFGQPGHVYVYLSYGVHTLLNIVCDTRGVAAAVLIRAFEPFDPDTRLRLNRGDTEGHLPPRLVASGPGRVGQALGLDLSWNGRPLGVEYGLMLLDDTTRPSVRRTPRVGVSAGGDLPLRYILPGSTYLSGKGRS